MLPEHLCRAGKRRPRWHTRVLRGTGYAGWANLLIYLTSLAPAWNADTSFISHLSRASFLKHSPFLDLCWQSEKGSASQSYGFSSSHVWMWELDHKESWVLKNWCFWTVVLEKTLESLLDCKEVQPVHPKGDQSWIFIGRTDAEAETPIFWPPDAQNWLIGKDSGAGRDWGQEEKGTTEDEMAGWHHRLDGHEFG